MPCAPTMPGQPPMPYRLLLLWCAGLYLRLTLLLAAPLGPLIAADLGLNQTGTGALTTIPVLMLALAAVAGAFVIARLGPRRTIAVCLLVIALGSVARAGASAPWTLYLATAVMGLGIAALQPALPAMLAQWSPGRIALGTAVYMNGMLMGEVLSAGLTLPVIMPLVGNDWRLAILAWTLPALLVALGFHAAGPGRGSTPEAGEHAAERLRRNWMPDWHDPLVWQLGLLLGASASLFFGTNAYMAAILAARDETRWLATGLLLFNTAQVVASVFMFRYAVRWIGSSGPPFWLMLASILGLALFLLLPGLPALLAAFTVSFTTGVLLILLVSLPPRMARSDGIAALSAGMFTVGYAVSFLVPLAGGLLADRTTIAATALLPMLLTAALTLPLCLALGRRMRRP